MMSLRCLISSNRTAINFQRAMIPTVVRGSSLARRHLLDPCPYSTKAGSPDIPRLPVPPLRQTLSRYLLSVKPLLSPEKYLHATQLVEEFGVHDSDGQLLQTLLEAKAQHCINWLEEWWLNVAYFDYRLPVPIHVNPGIYTPPLSFRGQDQQLRHAAKLISRVLEFKKSIDTMSLPVDKMGSANLCMKQFYRILGCCRVPCPTRDDVLVFPGGLPDSPKHITVLHNNHIFSLNVYGVNDQPLSIGQLYAQLKQIIDQSQTTGVPIGLLTTEHRDTWSTAYQELCRDDENRRSLLDIHSSIFVLCLDKSCMTSSRPILNNKDEKFSANSIFMGQVNHGGGSEVNTANRWFDKIFQVFISPDGLVGFNYEHSSAEGPPIVQMVDHCYSKLDGDLDDSLTSTEGLAAPRKLKFNLSKKVESSIHLAAKNIDKLIDNLSLVHYRFDLFGKDVLKTLKVSPDAFIQIAFQLAYYRQHKQCAATYESGSLRKFQHGRTDTIRSCSVASKAYCEAMDESGVSATTKLNLLQAALKSHRQYTDQVINGHGIDRHLLGLKLTALDNNLKVPALFTDPVYTDTCNWRISTSQVASKSGGLLCFGPVVDDGYGICYNPMDTAILFAISSWKGCNETDAYRLRISIGSAMDDARMLLATSLSSKL